MSDALLTSLKEWLQQAADFRQETQDLIARGQGPCPGGPGDQDLQCDFCCEYTLDELINCKSCRGLGVDTKKPGWNPCEACDGAGKVPRVHNLGDKCLGDSEMAPCPGKLRYRYGAAWKGDHDFTGGSCLRCHGLAPHLYTGEGPYASVEEQEIEITLSESAVRKIVAALER